MVGRRSARARRLGALVVAAAAFLGPEPASLAREYIVGCDAYEMSREARAALAARGGAVRQAWPEIGYSLVSGIEAADADALRGRYGILSISPNLTLEWIPERAALGVFDAEGEPGDATFFEAFQWNLRQTQADVAWGSTNRGAGASVCVLDTGIDFRHVELTGRVDLARSRSFVEDEPVIEDLNGHGTLVAALISSNSVNMASVAPDAELVAVKVLDRSGSGSVANVISGILYSAEVGCQVTNMSIGLLLERGQEPEIEDALQQAIDSAHEAGSLVVAAAGNDALNMDELPGKDFIALPAMLDHVISVGATAPVAQQNFDALTTYTNFGRRGVDVMAPGGDLVIGGVTADLIFSACSSFLCANAASYLFARGTSFSSPHAAGAAAVAESQFPGMGSDFLDDCVTDGADRIRGRGNDPLYGRGRVNVLGAARCDDDEDSDSHDARPGDDEDSDSHDARARDDEDSDSHDARARDDEDSDSHDARARRVSRTGKGSRENRDSRKQKRRRRR